MDVHFVCAWNSVGKERMKLRLSDSVNSAIWWQVSELSPLLQLPRVTFDPFLPYPKLFVLVTVVTHNSASWAVNVKSHGFWSCQPEPYHVLMPQDMSAVGMRACRHCRTPVFENCGDDEAPADKIRHVLIAIYCSWTSGWGTTLNQFWAPVATGLSAMHC